MLRLITIQPVPCCLCARLSAPQMYQQAVFCLEELLLHQPADISRHLLLADTLYTLGGAHNWRAARSYYSGELGG